MVLGEGSFQIHTPYPNFHIANLGAASIVNPPLSGKVQLWSGQVQLKNLELDAGGLSVHLRQDAALGIQDQLRKLRFVAGWQCEVHTGPGLAAFCS